MTSSPTEPPERGEIWLTVLGSGRPGELGKTRPAVVVSTALTWTGSPRDRVSVVPLSASSSASILSPGVAATTASGLEHASAALSDAVRGVVPSRLAKRIGRVTAAEQRQIDRALAVVLGLPAPLR
ncbi:MAG: type II toxin-antitoxin system PemK/MazF family toxin [Bifidobacteriaceae bacterium]|jgi:mRNA interferase MazF|nr:type II toxin-antitoxin system PemK/MazF family toxin [Bifidobacteriaceae bacterium]